MSDLQSVSAQSGNPALQINENFQAVSPGGLFGQRAQATSGLDFAYYGGVLTLPDGSLTDIDDDTITLPDSEAAVYIEATTAGVVSQNTSGFTQGSIPLFLCVTSSTAITSITDKRSYFYSPQFYKPRATVLADATSITPNADTTDIGTQANTQSVGTLTVNAPTGTPTQGQKLILRIKSTNIQTFSWNASYRASTSLPLPTASTGSAKTDYYGFIYNSTDSKWDFMAKVTGF